MATTTERPSAKELRDQKEARVAKEQAALAEARDRAAQEAAAEAAAAAVPTNGAGSHVDAQEGLFDTVVENDGLLSALEEREAMRQRRSELNLKWKETTETVKGILATLDVEDGGTIRCGRFRIDKTTVEAKSVAFETESTTRLTIGLIED